MFRITKSLEWIDIFFSKLIAQLWNAYGCFNVVLSNLLLATSRCWQDQRPLTLRHLLQLDRLQFFFFIFLVQKTLRNLDESFDFSIVDCVHKQSTGGFVGSVGDTIDLEIFFDVHEQLLRSKYWRLESQYLLILFSQTVWKTYTPLDLLQTRLYIVIYVLGVQLVNSKCPLPFWIVLASTMLHDTIQSHFWHSFHDPYPKFRIRT